MRQAARLPHGAWYSQENDGMSLYIVFRFLEDKSVVTSQNLYNVRKRMHQLISG